MEDHNTGLATYLRQYLTTRMRKPEPDRKIMSAILIHMMRLYGNGITILFTVGALRIKSLTVKVMMYTGMG